LAGAVRLAQELPDLAALILSAPGQALARTHTLVAKDLVPDERLGRIRPEAADRMTGLQRLLTGGSEAPAIVLAAVAHAEVASVRPFGTGDDLVARATEQLVLVARGLDPYGVVGVASGHLALREEYRPRLAGYAAVSGVGPGIAYGARPRTGAAARPRAPREEYRRRLAGYAAVSGVGPWIEYCARALTGAAERLGALLNE